MTQVEWSVVRAKTGERLNDFAVDLGLETTVIVALDGTRLRVLAAGRPDAPRLLLVHGFPQNAAEWRKVLPLVRARFRVLMPDLRGFGLSEPARAGDYDLETLAGDLMRILEVTGRGGATGAAHVVAHDWGGPLAWRLLERRPELVCRHVSINAPHPASYMRALLRDPAQRRSSWYTALFQIPRVEHLLASNGAAFFAWSLRVSSAPGTFSDEDLELYVGPMRDSSRLRAALEYYRAGRRRSLAEGSDVQHARPVEVPTIVLWGERDAAIRPSVRDDMVRRICPTAELRTLPAASHWVPDERPEEVARAIVDGLKAEEKTSAARE